MAWLKAAFLFLGVMLVAATWPAAALTISPTRIEIDAQSMKPFRLEITGTASATRYVELSLLRRTAGDGNVIERLSPASADSFMIRPPQVLVSPGVTRYVTVKWTGGTPKSSDSFYLIVEELPISVDPTTLGQSVSILARFSIPVHVNAGHKAQVSFLIDPKGGRYTLVNDGKAYQRLADLRFHAVTRGGTPGTQPHAVPGAMLARAAHVDALLPGGRIEFSGEDLGLAANQSIVAVVLP
jgi:P pilus assembly chaperone PapD